MVLCKIFMLQEVMILEDERSIFEGVSVVYNYVFVPSEPPANELKDFRHSGGLMTFFRKLLNICFKLISSTPQFSCYKVFSMYIAVL